MLTNEKKWPYWINPVVVIVAAVFFALGGVFILGPTNFPILDESFQIFIRILALIATLSAGFASINIFKRTNSSFYLYLSVALFSEALANVIIGFLASGVLGAVENQSSQLVAFSSLITSIIFSILILGNSLQKPRYVTRYSVNSLVGTYTSFVGVMVVTIITYLLYKPLPNLILEFAPAFLHRPFHLLTTLLLVLALVFSWRQAKSRASAGTIYISCLSLLIVSELWLANSLVIYDQSFNLYLLIRILAFLIFSFMFLAKDPIKQPERQYYPSNVVRQITINFVTLATVMVLLIGFILAMQKSVFYSQVEQQQLQMEFGLSLELTEEQVDNIEKMDQGFRYSLFLMFLIALVIIQSVFSVKRMIVSDFNRMDDVLEGLKDPVLVFDIDQEILVMNSQLRQLVKLDESRLNLDYLLRQLEAKVKGNSKQNLPISFTSAASTVLESNTNVQFEQLNFNGKVFEALFTSVTDVHGQITGAAMILHDVTYLKDLEEMKTEFVSIAAHQLRTPLTAVNWTVETLLDGVSGKLNKKQSELLNDIHGGVGRMKKLVGDLLNVSRIEANRVRIEPEEVELDKFVKQVISDIKPIAQAKDCRIVFKTNNGHNDTINLDKNLIYQVIHNLITNAIKYSPKRRCNVDVTLNKDEKGYLLSVKDRGMGIPKRVQSNVFEKFFRADNALASKEEGSGLGLYISKRIMDWAGGGIWFESEEDKGTTFYVSLPFKGMQAKSGERSLSG